MKRGNSIAFSKLNKRSSCALPPTFEASVNIELSGNGRSSMAFRTISSPVGNRSRPAGGNSLGSSQRRALLAERREEVRPYPAPAGFDGASPVLFDEVCLGAVLTHPHPALEIVRSRSDGSEHSERARQPGSRSGEDDAPPKPVILVSFRVRSSYSRLLYQIAVPSGRRDGCLQVPPASSRNWTRGFRRRAVQSGMSVEQVLPRDVRPRLVAARGLGHRSRTGV